MNALTLIQEEISDLKALIEKLPEWMLQSPAGAAYTQRLVALQAEAADADLCSTASVLNVPLMDLFVVGFPKHGAAPARFVGEFLQAIQAMIASLGQSATGKPTTRGLIPNDVVEQTSLDVLAFAPGSFVSRLSLTGAAQQVLPGESLAMRAAEGFGDLISVGAERVPLLAAIHRWRGRVPQSYARVLALLDSWNVDLSAKLARPGSATVRRYSITAGIARSALPILTNADKSSVEEESFTVRARLNAANRRTGAFEAELADGTIFSGRAASPEAFESVVIGGVYEINVTATIVKDALTELMTEQLTLDALRPIVSPSTVPPPS
ncbi:MAG TPA: hypothetical protein VH062_01400 [Polyangiaceae bacterium]|jgi:hypothetical protein|nr:hypothetical protein [Polyangiaceae bacterium]